MYKWSCLTEQEEYLKNMTWLSLFMVVPSRMLYCIACNAESHILYFSPSIRSYFPSYFKIKPPAAVKVARICSCWSDQLLSRCLECHHLICSTMSEVVSQSTNSVSILQASSILSTSKLDHKLFGKSTLSVLLYALLNSLHTYYTL